MANLSPQDRRRITDLRRLGIRQSKAMNLVYRFGKDIPQEIRWTSFLQYLEDHSPKPWIKSYTIIHDFDDTFA